MSKYHKNTGAYGRLCVNNISLSPSVQAAIQKISYLFPIGESDVSFTISKCADGSVKICRGAFSDAKSPLAHGGPGPTIPKSRIVQIIHDIMDGDACVYDESIEKVAEALSRYRPSTQADMLGELRKVKIETYQNKNIEMKFIRPEAIEEIIRKFEGGVK